MSNNFAKLIPIDPTADELAVFAERLPNGVLPHTIGLTTVRDFYKAIYQAVPDRQRLSEADNIALLLEQAAEKK